MPEVLRPRTLGELLGQTFSLSVANFGKLALIQLFFWIPAIVVIGGGVAVFTLVIMGMAEGANEDQQAVAGVAGMLGLAGMGLLLAILALLPQAASILAVADSFTGRSTGIVACYAAAFRRILPLVALVVLVGLIMLGGCFLACVGYFFFAIKLYIAMQVMVLEQATIGESISRSWDLTTGHFWKIFVFVIIIGVIGGVINSTLGLFGELLIFSDSMAIYFSGKFAVSALASLIPGILASVSAVVIYFELRTRKEALDLDGLVDMVDQIGPADEGTGTDFP